MSSPIVQAIKQICDEKGLTYESVLETIQLALAAAYRKDFGEKNQNIQAEFNPETGEMKAWDVKTVVGDVDLEKEAEEWEAHKAAYEAVIKEAEEKGEPAPEMEPFKRFNPKLEWMKSEAKKEYSKAKIGEVIRRPLEIPAAFGRMAAQTAKQVITQKLREAERELIFEDFKKQEGQLIVATVGRREGNLVLIEIGRATAILPPEEQIEGERYNAGARMKFYLVSVNLTSRGPEIRVSRTHAEIVRKIFEMEIPEIANGAVEIKGVAREAGGRSKVAVWAKEENVDPIGSCIGQRGSRIQTIISELGGEKVDIIAYDEDGAGYIAKALSPAKVLAVELDEENKIAKAKVAPDQYSLAIGRGGQNVRLASELTGWQIMVQQEGEKKVEEPEAEEKKEEAKEEKTEESGIEGKEEGEKVKKPTVEEMKGDNIEEEPAENLKP